MAFGSVGSLGTANATTSNGTNLVLTPTATLHTGNLGILIYAADSDDNTQGNSSSVSSVTDSGGNTWALLREFNADGDDATTQVVVSVWYTIATADVTLTTGNITVNLASNIHDARVATAWEFTIGAGNTINIANTPIDDEEIATDLPSMVISSLTSKEYLFLRAVGCNLRDGTFTPTSNYTTIPLVVANTGGGSSSRQGVGEFRILSATGSTSDPTPSSNPVSANIFLAIEEVVPSVTARSWVMII